MCSSQIKKWLSRFDSICDFQPMKTKKKKKTCSRSVSTPLPEIEHKKSEIEKRKWLSSGDGPCSDEDFRNRLSVP